MHVLLLVFPPTGGAGIWVLCPGCSELSWSLSVTLLLAVAAEAAGGSFVLRGPQTSEMSQFQQCSESEETNQSLAQPSERSFFSC